MYWFQNHSAIFIHIPNFYIHPDNFIIPYRKNSKSIVQ